MFASPAAWADAPALWASDPLSNEALIAKGAHFLAVMEAQASAESPAVHAMPAGPGSAHLVMLALSGIGAWRLTRGGFRGSFGAVPEWYHEGGPRQIGHARALDPSFSQAAMAVCPYPSPLVQPQLTPGRIGSRVMAPRAPTRVAPQSPRAPPRSSVE